MLSNLSYRTKRKKNSQNRGPPRKYNPYEVNEDPNLIDDGPLNDSDILTIEDIPAEFQGTEPIIDPEEDLEQQQVNDFLDQRDNQYLNRRYKREKKCITFYYRPLEIWENDEDSSYYHCEDNIQFLSDIKLGSEIYQRTGRIITVDSIEIKGVIHSECWYNFATSAFLYGSNGQFARMSILLDTQKLLFNNLGSHTHKPHGIKDIYENESPWSFKRTDVERKVLTLWEETFEWEPHSNGSTPDSGNGCFNVHKYIKTNFQIIYMNDDDKNEAQFGKDGEQSYGKNGILLVITNNTRSKVGLAVQYKTYWQGGVRIRFHEPHKRDYEYPD